MWRNWYTNYRYEVDGQKPCPSNATSSNAKGLLVENETINGPFIPTVGYVAEAKSVGRRRSAQEFENKILDITLRGIEDVKMVELEESYFLDYEEDGTPMNRKEWLLKTNGTNLNAIFGNDYVDEYNTISNNISCIIINCDISRIILVPP